MRTKIQRLSTVFIGHLLYNAIFGVYAVLPLKIEQSLFTDGSLELLDKEMLAEGFTLKGKAYDIDFAAADDEIREIDVREQDGGLPKVFKMESAEQRYFKEWFNNLPPESRVRQ